MSTLVQPALAPEDTLSTAVTAAPLAVPASASPAGDVGAPWFEKNLPALKDALTQIPGAQQGVEKILSSYLQAAITADTSDGLLLAMQCYLGDGPADLLLTLLTRGIDDRALFQQVADRLEPSDRPWAQLLLGVYGRRVRDAWVVGGELPDDWMTLNHEVNYSLYAENWLVRTTVIKYSGASFTVESRPGAYVNLVGAMSKVLTDLPDPGKASLPLPKLKEILDQWNELTWTVARLSRGERVAAALEALPAATDFATRTRWLRDIPHRHLTRNAEDASADLTGIVDQLGDMGILESGKRRGQLAVLAFIENVLPEASQFPDLAAQLVDIASEMMEDAPEPGTQS